jgi:flagellar protein FlgJ
MEGIQSPITPFDWQNIQRTEKTDSPERIRETAGQFESILIGMMLKSMRESSGGGWLGTGDEQALSSLSELAEQQVAQALASSGGFGLAEMVVQGLKTAELAGTSGKAMAENASDAGAKRAGTGNREGG